MNAAPIEVQAETSKAQIAEIPEVISTVDDIIKQCEAIDASPDSAKLEQIEQILRAIPTGKAALNILSDYEVPIRFTAGSGSYYNSKRECDIMVIDSDLDILDAVLVLVHEANHARYTLERYTSKRLTGDPLSQSRSEYVARRVEEEAESEVLSIEAKRELETAGFNVSEVTSIFETRFQSAYDKAVHLELTKIDPAIDNLDAVGREAGKRDVMDGFNDGWVVMSFEGKSYLEFYGDFWDDMQQ